jgi:hypothetical protein
MEASEVLVMPKLTERLQFISDMSLLRARLADFTESTAQSDIDVIRIVGSKYLEQLLDFTDDFISALKAGNETDIASTLGTLNYSLSELANVQQCLLANKKKC